MHLCIRTYVRTHYHYLIWKWHKPDRKSKHQRFWAKELGGSCRHTPTHAHSYTPTHAHTHSHAHSYTPTHSHSHTHPHTPTPTHSHSHPPTHPHTVHQCYRLEKCDCPSSPVHFTAAPCPKQANLLVKWLHTQCPHASSDWQRHLGNCHSWTADNRVAFLSTYSHAPPLPLGYSTPSPAQAGVTYGAVVMQLRTGLLIDNCLAWLLIIHVQQFEFSPT